MQKSFIAIALALTLTSAFAGYTAGNYSKAPQSVAVDSDTNYTSTNGGLMLASLTTSSSLYLVSINGTLATAPIVNFNVWYRQLDAKALTASSNLTANFTGNIVTGLQLLITNSYIVQFTSGNDSAGNPQIYVTQTPLTGGAALTAFPVTSNKVANFTPAIQSIASISKTIYFFYLSGANRTNVTNFAVGGTALGSLEFNLSTTYDTPSSLQVVWGESLGSSQLFASWIENKALKDATIDVSKGTVTVSTPTPYNASFTCQPYATDKKQYGDLCIDVTSNPGNITYWIRTTSSATLTSFANYFVNTSALNSAYAYGQYLAVFYNDNTQIATNGAQTQAYEILNLDTWTLFKNRTNFLTITPVNSTSTFYRVTSGGLYTLLWNNGVNATAPVTSVQVGLVLGSSYLTTIFGSLLAIIAGLLLF